MYITKGRVLRMLLFCKYKITQSSTTVEVYDKDVMLLTWIIHESPFDVVEIMYLPVLQCMYQTKDSFKNLRSRKPMLILPLLIVCIYFGVVMAPSGTMARRIEPSCRQSIKEASLPLLFFWIFYCIPTEPSILTSIHSKS